MDTLARDTRFRKAELDYNPRHSGNRTRTDTGSLREGQLGLLQWMGTRASQRYQLPFQLTCHMVTARALLDRPTTIRAWPCRASYCRQAFLFLLLSLLDFSAHPLELSPPVLALNRTLRPLSCLAFLSGSLLTLGNHHGLFRCLFVQKAL